MTQPRKPTFTFNPEFVKACERFNKALGDAVNNFTKQLDANMTAARLERKRKHDAMVVQRVEELIQSEIKKKKEERQ